MLIEINDLKFGRVYGGRIRTVGILSSYKHSIYILYKDIKIIASQNLHSKGTYELKNVENSEEFMNIHVSHMIRLFL